MQQDCNASSTLGLLLCRHSEEGQRDAARHTDTKLASLHPWGQAGWVLRSMPCFSFDSGLLYSKRGEGRNSLLCTKAARSGSFAPQGKNIAKSRETACFIKVTWEKDKWEERLEKCRVLRRQLSIWGGPLQRSPIHMQSHSRNRHVKFMQMLPAN